LEHHPSVDEPSKKSGCRCAASCSRAVCAENSAAAPWRAQQKSSSARGSSSALCPVLFATSALSTV
jgi:hypothetical protein